MTATNTPLGICTGATATLTATTSAGSTARFYTTATGGTALTTTTAGSYTTPALTASTTYYVAATTGGTETVGAASYTSTGTAAYVIPLNYTIPTTGQYTLYLPSASQSGLLRDNAGANISDRLLSAPCRSPAGRVPAGLFAGGIA